MANNISELMVKNFSSLVKEFIESMEGDVKSPMDAHVILTARDDAVVLVIAPEAKLYDVALDTMPIIMLEKKEDGLFRPVFDFLDDESAVKGLALWASFLEHALEVEDILKKDNVAPVKEEVVTGEIFKENKVHLSPRGKEYTKEDVDAYFKESNLLGYKAFDYCLDDYLDGVRANDILHPAPRIIETRRELSAALNRFKCENGFNNIKEVAKFLRLSTSQVWGYFNCKTYPTHKESKDVLESWLNVEIRKEVK